MYPVSAEQLGSEKELNLVTKKIGFELRSAVYRLHLPPTFDSTSDALTCWQQQNRHTETAIPPIAHGQRQNGIHQVRGGGGGYSL